MGGNSSKSLTESTREILNKSVTNVFSDTDNVTTSTITVKQNTSLSGIEAKGCTLGVKQEADVQVTVISQLNEDQVVTMKDAITNQLSSELESDATTESGFMATAIANSSTSETKVKETVKNIIESTFKSEVLNEVISNINNDQELHLSNIYLDPCNLKIYDPFPDASVEDRLLLGEAAAEALKECKGDLEEMPCGEIEQNTAVNAVVQNVTDKMMDALFDKNMLTESDITASSSATTKSEGIPSWIWIIIVCIVGLIIFVKFVLPAMGSRGASPKISREVGGSLVVNSRPRAVGESPVTRF